MALNGIYQEAATMAREEYTDSGLWTAVLLQALEDWKSCNRRLRAEAEKFFFDSGSDRILPRFAEAPAWSREAFSTGFTR